MEQYCESQQAAGLLHALRHTQAYVLPCAILLPDGYGMSNQKLVNLFLIFPQQLWRRLTRHP